MKTRIVLDIGYRLDHAWFGKPERHGQRGHRCGGQPACQHPGGVSRTRFKCPMARVTQPVADLCIQILDALVENRLRVGDEFLFLLVQIHGQ